MGADGSWSTELPYTVASTAERETQQKTDVYMNFFTRSADKMYKAEISAWYREERWNSDATQ